MSSNQVYRNDAGLGSSKYIPMVGNNTYQVSGTPIIVAAQATQVIPWVTTPPVDYSNNYFSLDNIGNITILQDGIYSFAIYLSLLNPTTDATHNVLAYTMQLFDNTQITNIVQKREGVITYHVDAPNIPTILTDLNFVGFFPAGESLRVQLMSNYGTGVGSQNINITSGQLTINKLE